MLTAAPLSTKCGSESINAELVTTPRHSTCLPPTGRFGVDGRVGVPGCVGHARPPPPEEAAQDAALQRLQQRALPGSRVSEQLEFDPGLDRLSGPQLLDVAQLVVVLTQKHTTEEDERLLRTAHRHLYTTPTRPPKIT